MRSLKEEAPPSSLGDKLIQIGLNTPPYLMIPLALLATGLLPLPFDFVAELFLGAQPIGGPGLGSHGVVSGLIVGCLIAPLAETALNQWACITLLRRKCGVGRWMAILLSSALFASMHFYSWKYVITTFPVGLVLGYVYVVERIRLRWAFWIVTMIHSSRNAISIALVHYRP